MIKLSQLKFNPNNPNKASAPRLEILKSSLAEFPKMMRERPIVVDEDWMILGGHQKVAACKKLGMKEIPDEWVRRVLDYTPEEKEKFLLNDNSHAGELDFNFLTAKYTPENLAKFNITVPVDFFKPTSKFNSVVPDSIKEAYGLPTEQDIEGEPEEIDDDYESAPKPAQSKPVDDHNFVISMLVDLATYTRWEDIKAQNNERNDIKMFQKLIGIDL